MRDQGGKSYIAIRPERLRAPMKSRMFDMSGKTAFEWKYNANTCSGMTIAEWWDKFTYAKCTKIHLPSIDLLHLVVVLSTWASCRSLLVLICGCTLYSYTTKEDTTMGLLTFSSNIADAEAPPQLPPGEYKCICNAAQDKVAASQWQHMLTLTLQVPRSEFPADFDPGDGVDELTFTLNIVARDIPADRWRMKKTCQAFGVAAV